MLQKFLPVFGALLLAGPASAITINMTDFTFGAPASVDMEGSDGSPSYEGTAGEFTGGVVDGLAATVVASTRCSPRPRPDRSSPGAPS